MPAGAAQKDSFSFPAPLPLLFGQKNCFHSSFFNYLCACLRKIVCGGKQFPSECIKNAVARESLSRLKLFLIAAQSGCLLLMNHFCAVWLNLIAGRRFSFKLVVSS